MGMRVERWLFAVALLFVMSTAAEADFSDFTEWTPVADPPDVNMTGSAIAAQATLNAGIGAIPAGTDIGYQSVNGLTAATSTAGYVFDPASDFTIAIDYDLSFVGSPQGVLALGFGVGVDGDGEDSAGMGMATLNGAAVGVFTGAARVGDVDQPNQPTTLAAALSGSLFVEYDAGSGDVKVGASQTMGAASPTQTTTFSGIQSQWPSGDLLVSFFLRSQSPGWGGGGTGEAVFSNVRIDDGTVTEVPEPASLMLLGLGGAALLSRKRLQ